MKRHRERYERLKEALRSWQEQVIEYHRCPECGNPVAMSGVPCMAGICTFCGALVGESDMGEKVDPLAVIADLQARLR